MNQIYQFSLRTSEKNQLINIEKEVKFAIANAAIKEGSVTVFSPHIKSAIIANTQIDDCDRILVEDEEVEDTLSHSETFFISDGKLVMDRFESLYFFEKEGYQDRKFFVKIDERKNIR